MLLHAAAAKCIYYDYLIMVAAKFADSPATYRTFVLEQDRPAPATNLRFEYRICQAANSTAYINCTRNPDLDRNIAFATFEVDSAGQKKCVGAYYTFGDVVTAGFEIDSFRISDSLVKVYFQSKKYRSNLEVKIELGRNRSLFTSHQLSNLPRFLGSSSLLTEEVSVDLEDQLCSRYVNFNFFLDGYTRKWLLLRGAFTGMFVLGLYFRPQDHSTCGKLKLFKITIVWFVAFRLINALTVFFWEEITSSELDCLIATINVVKVLLLLVMLKVNDPNFVYLKVASLLHCFALIDYIGLLFFVDNRVGFLGLLWFYGLYFTLPKCSSKISDVSEWRLSLTVSLEILAFFVLPWPKSLGIAYIVWFDLRPFFLSPFMLWYILSSLLWAPLLAAGRYKIARSLLSSHFSVKKSASSYLNHHSESDSSIAALKEELTKH